MTYTRNKWNRLLKKNLELFFNNTIFKSMNLTISWKIIVFWVFILIFSMFLPWLKDMWENVREWNVFNKVLWINWLIFPIISLVIFFNLFSKKQKNKLKMWTNLTVNDSSLYITLWSIIILLTINSLVIANWLTIFQSEIVSSKWIIFAIISWIMIIAWGIINKKEWNKLDKQIYKNEAYEDSNVYEKKEQKDNLKLPF